MKILKSKRAEIEVPMFLVKAIVAIMLIVFIVFVFAGIMKIFYPGDDKATQKSFEEFHSLVNSKMTSDSSYDSNKYTVYLKKNYQVFIFDSSDRFFCDKDHLNSVLKPALCDKFKRCLCLYKDSPDKTDRDKNIVECKELPDVEVATFEMNDFQCKRDNDIKFYTMIVAVQKQVVQSNTKKVVYIWEDNDKNRAQDAEFSRPVCPDSSPPICKGVKQDSFLTGVNNYQAVLDECSKAGVATVSAKCAYNANFNKCELQCLNPIDCSKISSCSDYASISEDGLMNNKYMIKDSNAFFACNNDQKICAASTTGCIERTFGVYTCMDTKDNCDKAIAANQQACHISKKGQTGDNKPIIAMDENCASQLSMFTKYQIFGCKTGADCNKFIQDKTSDCSIRTFVDNTGETFIYDFKPSCIDDVQAYFQSAWICDAKAVA